MSTVKIEHVNPNTSHAIAFDVMAQPRRDKAGNEIKAERNPDGTATYPDGTVVTVDRDGREIRDTIVLSHGHFKIIELSGGLMLHEVSAAELAERQRLIQEQRDLKAEVARERKAKDDRDHAERIEAERKEHKARIEAQIAGDDEFKSGSQWTPEQREAMARNEKPTLVLNRADEPKAAEPQPDPVI